MVKIGDVKIKFLYIGDAKIKKAYVGENLIFGETKPSRLPEGYTEVEYIYLSGAVGFNTNYRVTPSKTRVLFDIEMEAKSAASNEYLLYQYGNTATSRSHYFYIARNSETDFRISLGWAAGTYDTFSTGSVTVGKIAIDLNAQTRKVVIGDFSGSTRYPETSAFISGYLYIGTRSESGAAPTSKLYSCKIYESGALKFDFVPCTDPSGEVGLFDLVGSKFYANSIGGTVTAGPSV